MANKIQIRRGNKANLPTLSAGEPAFCTDTNQLFVGNGSTNIEYAKQISVDSLNSQMNENTQNINNHKTESIYEQFTVIRDLTVEGIQTFALATNKIPKRIEIVATVGVPGTKLSNGSWSESGSASQSNMFTWGGASSMNFATTSNLLFISENSVTVATKADFHNRWAGGFDITWSKVGTGATGTATLLIKVSYHD